MTDRLPELPHYGFYHYPNDSRLHASSLLYGIPAGAVRMFTVEQINAHALAAYRAGMEQAAQILRDVPIDHAFSDTIKACQAAIRRAAEGKQ